MGSLTERDIKQIVLIKNKIFMFEKDKLDLFELICDLGGLLNELESVSEFWKDDFQAEVNWPDPQKLVHLRLEVRVNW